MAYSTRRRTSSTVCTSGTTRPRAPTSSIFRTDGRVTSFTRTKGVQFRADRAVMAVRALSTSAGPCSVSTMAKSMPAMPMHWAAAMPPSS